MILVVRNTYYIVHGDCTRSEEDFIGSSVRDITDMCVREIPKDCLNSVVMCDYYYK